MTKRSYWKDVVAKIGKLDRRSKIEGVGRSALDYPLYKIKVNGGKKNVLISAGVHGHEIAGVYATLKFLEGDFENYLDEFTFHVYPCINPWGYENDQMGNQNGKNLNRSFFTNPTEEEIVTIQKSLSEGPKDYIFTMDLHENDPRDKVEGCVDNKVPTEFCLYEFCVDKNKRIGQKIVEKVEKEGFSICKWPTVYGDLNTEGVIWYPEGLQNEDYKKQTTFEAYLYNNYTKQTFTIETPTVWNLDDRVNLHLLALKTALTEFSKK